MTKKYDLSIILLLAPSGVWAQPGLDQANKTLLQPDLISTPNPQTRPKIKIEADASVYNAPDVQRSDGIFVGAVNVEGAPDLAASDFGAAIEPFVGRSLQTQDMTALCHALADVARGRGYSFASAYIPPQALALGVLRVVVDEGVIAEVRISGTANKQLKRALGHLIGHAATTAETEKQVMLASDIPGITVQKVSFVREGARGILIVTASERRLSGVTILDNYGSKILGPARVTVAATLTSTLRDGDALTIAGVTTPLKPKELNFVALKYTLPVDADGTVLSVSGSRGLTRPGGILGDFDVRGSSSAVGVAASHPVFRSRKASLWMSGGLDYVASDQTLSTLPLSNDHLTTLWLSLTGDTEMLHGKLRSELTLTRGLPWFNATRSGDLLTSRTGADGVFTKLKFSADWVGTLSGSVSLRLATVAQLASGPLLSAQEISIGGPSFGRAFEFSERSGDNGVLGLAELRADFNHPTQWMDWVQPYVFVDGGKVYTLGNTAGNDTLLSGGGGVRARYRTTSLSVESAFPLNTDRLESGNKKPRLNVQLINGF